jgi:hypothetical protein
MALPVLNEDTLPVILASAGIPLKGDGQLQLMGGSPLRACDGICEATATSALLATGYSSGDTSAIVAALRRRSASDQDGTFQP